MVMGLEGDSGLGQVAATTVAQLSAWLRPHAQRSTRVSGEELVTQWRGRGGRLTKSDAFELAAAMDRAATCFEPDIRFSGHVIRPADTVVLFLWDDPPRAASPAYLAAATIARLGVIVSSADGTVVSEEQALLRERTSRAIDLTQPERRRLEAYVDWLLDTPIALDAGDREAAGLSEANRIRIGRFLVAVAGADGYISTPERWMLTGIFALFGLTAEQLDGEVASIRPSVGGAPRRNSTPDAMAADSPAETIQLSPAAIREVLDERDEAIANLAGLMPVAPFKPSTPAETVSLTLDLIAEPDSQALPEMSDLEEALARQWAGLSAADRRRPGSLLALVPQRAHWPAFISAWKTASLLYWLKHMAEYPHALAVLFGGFAFFEYDDTAFWPQFERDLWPLTPNQQAALRAAHAKAIANLGLEMARNNSDDRMSVASAVHHIGVPLSLWADFLGVADHILGQADWTSWTSERWTSDVTARCGPRTRLRDFLTANQASARETIAELGEIREFASAEPTSTIEDLARVANVPFLRDEYFDEVPETAEFFRPDNLLSLFAGRCFLRYDDENSRLQVHLPGVDDPAGRVWRVGDHEKSALRYPEWFTIDSAGFARWIDVDLVGPSGRSTKRIAGIGDWGLYDQRRQAFVDLDLRHVSERRMGDYLLVSSRPLTHMTRQGFLQAFPENQVERLADGMRCYVTRLSPAALDGSLQLRWATAKGDLLTHSINFRTRFGRSRTIVINGVERPMGDPSLPWYFLRPGPYPPISYAALPLMELTKLNNQGSASAYARLRRYTEEGVIVARPDGAWRLDRERATVIRVGETVEVSFLGLPSRLWALGNGNEPLSLEIVAEEGLTYLRAAWPATREHSILETLRRFGVEVVRP